MTARQMIGVSEISRLLRKEISLEECVQLIQAATRQYAKRQLTWFRHRMAGWDWIDAQEFSNIIARILSQLA